MLGLSKRIRQRTARALLALVGGLWLVAAAAPCVAAMSACPMGMTGDCVRASNECPTLNAVDCQTSNDEWLAASVPVLDFSVVPVRLHSLPALPALTRAHAPDRYATAILRPPLNLQHAVLLI